MTETIPKRKEAYNLLCQYTKSESLIKHALSVEAVMQYYAQKFGEDEEKWGIIGLVHDLDWEQFPSLHCQITKKILEAENWPSDYIRAILSHGWGTCTEVKPELLMEKILFTIDELTGLVTTTALVRPSKSIFDVKVKSVKKKWKDHRFAAGVDRSIIEKGALMLNMNLSDLIQDTINAMQQVAEEIGLSGK